MVQLEHCLIPLVERIYFMTFTIKNMQKTALVIIAFFSLVIGFLCSMTPVIGQNLLLQISATGTILEVISIASFSYCSAWGGWRKWLIFRPCIGGAYLVILYIIYRLIYNIGVS